MLVIIGQPIYVNHRSVFSTFFSQENFITTNLSAFGLTDLNSSSLSSSEFSWLASLRFRLARSCVFLIWANSLWWLSGNIPCMTSKLQKQVNRTLNYMYYDGQRHAYQNKNIYWTHPNFLISLMNISFALNRKWCLLSSFMWTRLETCKCEEKYLLHKACITASFDYCPSTPKLKGS